MEGITTRDSPLRRKINAMCDDADMQFTLALKVHQEAIKLARDMIADAWKIWGLENDYAARLVVSELATNAFRNSVGDVFWVRCYRRFLDNRPVIEVWDDSPEGLVMGPLDDASTTGRGLFIVEDLVEDFEVLPTTEGGKIVRAYMAA